MNRRRAFLGGVLGTLAGLLGIGKVRAAKFDPTVADRDADGDCQVRVYRREEDGTYLEIPRGTEKPGDRVIWIGQDGHRLWRATSFTVAPEGVVRCDDGKLGVYHSEWCDLIAEQGKESKPATA